MIALFLRVVLPETPPTAEGLAVAQELMAEIETKAKNMAIVEVELLDVRAAK